MRKNTIISSFKNIPRGALVLALLFLGTELFLNIIRPQIVLIFWNKFTINERLLMDIPRDFDYILMGNSIQKTGIDPRQVSDDILNMGLPGAKPISFYLLLNRYLETHNPPKAVFLSLDPEDVGQAMHIILKYFVTWKEYKSLWNYLTRDERIHFFLKYWVSLDERIVSFPLRQCYFKSNKTFKMELIQNLGFMPLPNEDSALEDDYFKKTGARPEKTISLEIRDFVYLDKFISLARANNIKVIILGNVLPKELYEIGEGTGFNRRWLVFLDDIKKRFSGVEAVKEPVLVLENKYFADVSHVNKEGRAIYTEYFKNQVFVPFSKEITKAQ